MSAVVEREVKAEGMSFSAVGLKYKAASVSTLVPSDEVLAALIASGPVIGLATYEATYLASYEASITSGTAAMKKQAEAVVEKCPSTQLVLAGYSQGAIVAHDTELQLSQNALHHIAGTLLLADGDRAPDTAAHIFGGASEGGEGIRPYLKRTGKTDVPLPTTTAEICIEGDIVCAFDWEHLIEAAYGSYIHTHYLQDDERLLEEASEWVAERIETDTGGSSNWTAEPLAIPPRADPQTVGLWSVSCTATTACTAVGADADAVLGPDEPLAEFWNGSAWSVETIADSSSSSLSGVSCTSASACVAVGSLSGGGPVAEVWDGSTWTAQSMPDRDDETKIYSVACVSASSCEAVGVERTGINVPVAEHWDGSSWSLQSAVDPHPPNEPGGENAGLYGITCTSANACIAVGEQELFSQDGEDPALAEKWNGTAWSLMSLPSQHAFQYC